jgi:hypothetical protein
MENYAMAAKNSIDPARFLHDQLESASPERENWLCEVLAPAPDATRHLGYCPSAATVSVITRAAREIR